MRQQSSNITFVLLLFITPYLTVGSFSYALIQRNSLNSLNGNNDHSSKTSNQNHSSKISQTIISENSNPVSNIVHDSMDSSKISNKVHENKTNTKKSFVEGKRRRNKKSFVEGN